MLVQDIDAERAALTAARLDREGRDFDIVVCDIADPEADRHILATALARWQRLDILVKMPASASIAPLNRSTRSGSIA